MQYDPMKRP